MAVVATLRLAAVEGNCGRPVLARIAAVGHLDLRLVLDTQHTTKRRRQPTLNESAGVAGVIRWVGEDYIVRKRLQQLGECERRLAMNLRHSPRVQNGNVLFERAQAPGILLDEISRNRAPRKCLEAERAGTGIEVEHPGAGQVELEYAHPRLSHAVERRPHQRTRWCVDSATAPATRDYAHGRGLVRETLCVPAATRINVRGRCLRFSPADSSHHGSRRARVGMRCLLWCRAGTRTPARPGSSRARRATRCRCPEQASTRANRQPLGAGRW